MATTTKKKITPTPVIAPTPVAPVATTKLVSYSHPDLKISPRKLRLLVNDIKKSDPSEILTKLQFVNTNASRLFAVVLKNAISNAKSNQHLNPATLKFAEVRVDEGKKIKRMDKSHGSRFARGVRIKRHSRLVIVLSGTISG